MAPTLRAILNGQCHKRALIHVVFHAVIALVPLTAVIVMFLYGRWKAMFFMENGEFYIYSVVFLTMAIYAFASLGLKKDDWGILLVILTVLILITALIAYGSLIHDKIVSPGQAPVSRSLKISSWILLVVSLVTFYVATYWEFYREYVIKETTDRKSIDELKNKLP